MPRVAQVQRRKAEHLRINLEEDVSSALGTGLARYRLMHQALPELSLDEIDTGLSLFGRRLRAPILVSSMTGGTPEAAAINQRLAEAAQSTGIALGVGSQRAAIEDPRQAATFNVRRYAPDALLFANLGAVQLNYGYGPDECHRAVDMIGADALILHLNPLQEAVQAGGNTNFSGLAGRIEEVVKKIGVPVIAKEVGWGISADTAKLLAGCGVAAIDVAGAGGTSWSQVEMHRAKDEFTRQLAASFVGWGIPTAESIVQVRDATPGMIVFASGGTQGRYRCREVPGIGGHFGRLGRTFPEGSR